VNEMKTVYLDSSAIVKRYVAEAGSEAVDLIFDRAETGSVQLLFSVWNVGEVLGVIDRYCRRGLISKEEMGNVVAHFLSESAKLTKLGGLSILPMTADALIDSWLLVLRRHIYVADALQVELARRGCDALLSGDEKLAEVAISEGINAINVERAPDKVRELAGE